MPHSRQLAAIMFTDIAGTLMEELKIRSLLSILNAPILPYLPLTYLGDVNTALDYLEKGYDDGDPLLISIKYSPYVPASLRNDPPFSRFIRKNCLSSIIYYSPYF